MKKEERIARQKRLARAIQVREAQRRRRARLKNENQKFLQIIVPDALREAIFEYGTENNLTLQEAAVVLIEQALQFPSGGHSITFTRSKSTPVISTETERPAPVRVKVVAPIAVPVVIPVAAEELHAPAVAVAVAEPVLVAVAEPEPEPVVEAEPVAVVAAVAVAEEAAPDPVWDVPDEDDGQLSLF